MEQASCVPHVKLLKDCVDVERWHAEEVENHGKSHLSSASGCRMVGGWRSIDGGGGGVDQTSGGALLIFVIHL